MRQILVCLFILLQVPALAEPASVAFGRHVTPSASEPGAFGSYAKGCLAGGMQLRETASGWQAMRLSRNRNWGHPEMIHFIERLSLKAQAIGWPRLYVGDIGQPRGGPMKSGHRSHQIGLDVDIWLRMPDVGKLSRKDRERISSHVVVAKNGVSLNKHWTLSHHQVIRAAAEDPAVARIFVNAAIKRQMCRDEREASGKINAPWLRKVRPWKGHNAHFHVRLACPFGSPGCRDQAPPPPGTGCGAELAKWFPRGQLSRSIQLEKPSEEEEAAAQSRTRAVARALLVSDLPGLCREVLETEGAAVFASTETADQNVPARPVFANRNDRAHDGFVGTKYFWRPSVDRTAAERQRIVLKLEGKLPDGLKFVDRGGGNALVSGVPQSPGSYPVAIAALRKGREKERQNVVIEIERLGKPAAASVMASLDHHVRDFLTDFTGDECFLAVPAHVSKTRIDFEAFADDPAPFYVFDGAFKSAIGIEANVGGRMVTPAQCDALAFARALPDSGPPRVTVDDPDRLVEPGQELTLSVPVLKDRTTSLLLIDPTGQVTNLTRAVRHDGSILSVSLRSHLPGPHIVMALEASGDAAAQIEGDALQVFQRLRSDGRLHIGVAQATLGYFIVQ